MEISFEVLSKAVEELQQKDEHVNCTSLARHCRVPYSTMFHRLHTQFPELKEKLGIHRVRGRTHEQRKLFKIYVEAAEAISEEGELPSISSLSARLGWLRKRVRWYLEAHPTLARSLCIHSELEWRVWNACRALRDRGEKITRLAIAQEMRSYRKTSKHAGYRTIVAFLKKNPIYFEVFDIEKAEQGSGVALQVHGREPNLPRAA